MLRRPAGNGGCGHGHASDEVTENENDARVSRKVSSVIGRVQGVLAEMDVSTASPDALIHIKTYVIPRDEYFFATEFFAIHPSYTFVSICGTKEIYISARARSSANSLSMRYDEAHPLEG
jgi:hypothetical protein